MSLPTTQQGTNRVPTRIGNTISSARYKAHEIWGKLKNVQGFSDYEEDALKFGMLLVSFSITPIVYRPLRNLQIKQQLDTHKPNEVPYYNGYLNGFKTMIKEEGFLSLFKGGIAQAIYEVTRFGVRALTLTYFTRYVPRSLVKEEYLPFLGAAVVAVTDTIGYPIATAYTRIVGQKAYSEYTGLIDALEKTAHEDKTPQSESREVDLNPFKPAWYAGLVPHLVSIGVFTVTEVAFKFLYDKAFGFSNTTLYVEDRIDRVPSIRIDLESDNVIDINFGSPRKNLRDARDYALMMRSPLCFFVSQLASYPFEVVSRRMQAGDKELRKVGFLEGLRLIVQREGIQGLYKGLLFN